MLDIGDGRDREPSLEVRQLRRPDRRNFLRDHHQRSAGILRLVPGVEQLLLAALIGLVEQTPADPFDKAAREQGPPGAPWPGYDRRLHGPQAPLAEMLKGVAIGIRDDEAEVTFALGPVERKRDLVRPVP